MAKITYLSNMGFAVETPDVLLVFDDYNDPAHTVVKALEHNPALPVVFLASDHRRFNKAIFNIGQNHKRQYLLANNCPGEPTVTCLHSIWLPAIRWKIFSEVSR